MPAEVHRADVRSGPANGCARMAASPWRRGEPPEGREVADNPAGTPVAPKASPMQKPTSRLLLGLLLLAGARNAAAENWASLSEDGIEMEVDLDSTRGGMGTFRMAKDGLERTLGRLAA